MKIVVVGIGYVGLSNLILLAQKNHVVGVDLCSEKVAKLNNGLSPIVDRKATELLAKFKKDGTIGVGILERSLSATVDLEQACDGADYIIIATPTDYDSETDCFDTNSIEEVLSGITCKATIVVKSTVPVGYTRTLRERFCDKNILFSPEFLREGKAVHDNLYPSRIIIGSTSPEAKMFGRLLQEACWKKDVPVLYTGSSEAEAIKLFSNGYLAMRVAFFNELDTFSEVSKLNTKDIIDGVSLDPRIGQGYNNPSFGYGGYCFPKDTKQLKSNYDGIPNEIISAIVSSNDSRKKFIADQVIYKSVKTLGIYRLVMKVGSDNFRSAAIYDIASQVMSTGINVIVFEPEARDLDLQGLTKINDLETFKIQADLILCNRISSDLDDVAFKVYSRDIYGSDV